MKRFLFASVITIFSQLVSNSAESPPVSLNDVNINVRALKSRTNHYDYKSFASKNGKKEETDYATIIIRTEAKPDGIFLHDTITLGPAFQGMVFDRRLKYSTNSLLHPQQISLDVGRGDKIAREMSYEKGEMNVRGETEKVDLSAGDGIVSFNALLRIAPLLPRHAGRIYTFTRYGEPFLFRIREPKKDESGATLKCEGLEKLAVGAKGYDCVKFRMEMKSYGVQTDVWVSVNDNVVVKFADILPKGADAELLEATLKQ